MTAAALGGVGVLALVTHNADIQRFNDYTSPELTTPDKKCATTATDKGGPYCQKLLKHADDMKRWAIIGLSGAAVAGTVAAILVLNSAPAETAAIRPAGGMALGLRADHRRHDGRRLCRAFLGFHGAPGTPYR